ncbi:DUF5640 domain-containing protein [Ruminococcus sp.]|uniref:DUF5640 domain-containing protein n=1 Tax=Ruminococcus sp. TaxID=41978 RepID=UPI00388E52DC
MDENKIPEVTAELEKTASDIQETVAENTENAEAIGDTLTEAPDEQPEQEQEAESVDGVASADTGIENADTEAVQENGEEEPVKKKKSALQMPVIISLCIVVAALLGYFIFTGFFLKEPEGVTWSNEIDGATYYYEFKNDGTFDAYVGSVEIHTTYQKSKTAEGNTLTVGATIGDFYSGAPATYEITGSRLLGNQTLTCKYNEEYQFTVKQSAKKDVDLELPKDFTPDENLLGTWLFKYMNYDIYKATFNKDGSMTLEFVQDGIKYNGTYTLSDGKINFTYYVAENFSTPLEYSVDGDTLNFMGYTFVREGSAAAEATPDQQVIAPQQ